MSSEAIKESPGSLLRKSSQSSLTFRRSNANDSSLLNDNNKNNKNNNELPPRSYNNQEEVVMLTAEMGVKKTEASVAKTIYLGFLAGTSLTLTFLLILIMLIM
jgi:hypothetical protein